MKKTYLIAAITVFSIIGCQQKDKAASEADGYTMEDTTTVSDENAVADATSVTDTTAGSNDVKLPDTISVKTTRLKTDTSNKYALAGTKWRLVELNGKEVKNNSDKAYVLMLDSKTGKISGYMGCNSIMGSYLMKEANKITFLYVGSTKMACPDMSLEDKFMKMLPKVDNYMVEGSMLHLHKGKRNAFAKFEAVPQ